MPINIDPQQEVIWKIQNLLPTIDEALQHMIVQLDELRIEESSLLFQDVAEAINSIANSLLPLLTTETTQNILPHMRYLRQAIIQVADDYEVANLVAVQSSLIKKLIPAFNSWRQEIGTVSVKMH